MDDRNRPGIGTYVAAIGVIALLSAVALIVLGSQVSMILSTSSGGI